jgi:hypothetical protein
MEMRKDKKKLPKIIKDVGFDFHWEEKKVWDLDLPVEEMDLSELEWHFDIPFWWTEGGFYDFKPIWAIDEPAKYPERYKRIIKTDLSYPLDIMFWKGRWLLLDGLHRLAKAKLEGKKKVMVRKVPKEAIPKITK